MKKRIIAIIVTLAIIGGAAFGAFKFGLFGGSTGGTSESEIYVSTLGEYMGIGSSYSSNVFMGVVEGQETNGVTKASDREINEIYVKVGDTIEKGDKLFSYKTDSLEESITNYGFDIEGYKLQIADYNRQLATLTNTLNKTSGADERADLQNQIDSINTQIAMTNNSIEKTNTSIEEAKKKIKNSVITASAPGIITKISNDDSDNYSSDGYFITFLASDEMRVKGKVNEQNVYSINVDTPVTVRSRVDSSMTWKGVITKIDTESKSDSDSGNNYYSDSSENSSTSYPFYVELENSDGLMMGQHLYIEIGGDTEAMDLSSGTYIYDYLIAYDEDGSAYVWTMGKGKKLVKTVVELGDYNSEAGLYEVKAGLDYDTYVTFPMEDYEEGMSCIAYGEGEE